MTLKFDTKARPEENIAAFFSYLRGKDAKLADFLESRLNDLISIGENRSGSTQLRASVSKAAVGIVGKDGDEHGA